MLLNEIASEHIKQRMGKIKRSGVARLDDGDAVAMRSLESWHGFDEITGAASKWKNIYGIHGADIHFRNLPAPNADSATLDGHTRVGAAEQPACAGVALWVFDDSTGVTFLLFTDEHQQEPEVGTYILIRLPPELQREHTLLPDELLDSTIAGAIHRLYNLLLSY